MSNITNIWDARERRQRSASGNTANTAGKAETANVASTQPKQKRVYRKRRHNELYDYGSPDVEIVLHRERSERMQVGRYKARVVGYSAHIDGQPVTGWNIARQAVSYVYRELVDKTGTILRVRVEETGNRRKWRFAVDIEDDDATTQQYGGTLVWELDSLGRYHLWGADPVEVVRVTPPDPNVDHAARLLELAQRPMRVSERVEMVT